jgi:hypothetical protein
VPVAAEAGTAGGAAQLAGVLGGGLGCVGEGGGGVREAPVVLAGLVEAVREVDAQAAEPGGEALELVVRCESEQVSVESVEQGGPAGPDRVSPGGDLPLVPAGMDALVRHAHILARGSDIAPGLCR